MRNIRGNSFKFMYPLKFHPIVKDKIWGGNRLELLFGKNANTLPNIGESWEISSVPGDISIVSNGEYAGKSLKELIETHKDALVGKNIYERFQTDLPLLFKLIDANDDLSIQVHPNDEVGMKRHNSFGKTEMWYVLDTVPNAYLIIGFKKDTTQKEYLEALEAGTVEDLLQKVYVKAGDVFFIPAGLVHAIGKGVLIAEIQQTSDITYRIFDFNRRDSEGNTRELHTEEALDVINFSASENPKTEYTAVLNQEVPLVSCEYFTTDLLEIDQSVAFTHNAESSFTAFMCVEGEVIIKGESFEDVAVKKGESVLVPAGLKSFELNPSSKSRLLKVSI